MITHSEGKNTTIKVIYIDAPRQITKITPIEFNQNPVKKPLSTETEKTVLIGTC